MSVNQLTAYDADRSLKRKYIRVPQVYHSMQTYTHTCKHRHTAYIHTRNVNTRAASPSQHAYIHTFIHTYICTYTHIM